MCQAPEATENNVPCAGAGSKEDAVTFEEALDKTGVGWYNWAVLALSGALLLSMAFEAMAVSVLVPASACELLTTPAQQGVIAAVPLMGVGWYNWAVLALSGALLLSMAFEAMAVSVLVPASACELLTTPAQQGVIAAVPLMGIILTSHVWGYLADTRGRRPVLLLTLTVGGIAGLLSALAPNWIVFSLLKFISCSAVSGTNALTFTLLSEFTPQRRRNTMMILAMSIFMLGQGLLAVVAVPILPLKFSYHVPWLGIRLCSWRLLSAVYSAPCLLSACAVARSHETPKFLYSAGRVEGALRVLRAMHAANRRDTREEYPVKAIVAEDGQGGRAAVGGGAWAAVAAQVVPLVRQPFLKGTLLLASLYVVVFICAIPYFSWLPTIADGYMKASERGEEGLTFCQMLRSSQNYTRNLPIVESSCDINSQAMVMVFLLGLLFTCLNCVIGVVVERVGRRSLLLGIPIVCACAGLVLNFVTNTILSVFLFVLYVCSVLSMGLLAAITVEIYPTHLRAMAVCLTLMVGRGSAVLGVNLLKWMLEEACEVSFYTFGTITLTGAVIAYFLPSDKNRA